jgi:hypothetical protein
MEVGCFGTSPSQRRETKKLHDSSEVAFLKRELLDLERVIKALHTSRSDDRHLRLEAESRATRTVDETQQWRAACEMQLHEAQEALRSLRVEHAAALAAAASREAETQMLHVELGLVCSELFDADAEREAARESEGSALSIARSYRSFAAQGATRLEEMRQGMEGVQTRLLHKLEGYQCAATHALRLRGLRSVRGWKSWRGLYHAMSKWVMLVFTAEQRAAVAARLEAAYRHRDQDLCAQRVQLATERRDEREAAQAEHRRCVEEVKGAKRAQEAAAATAGVERERRIAAERERDEIRVHLDEALRQAEMARQANAAELAAARDQLASARRDIVMAVSPVAAAREARQALEMDLETCRAALQERNDELVETQRVLALERESRQEEAHTRVFLERVLRDERMHAAHRSEEALLLGELCEEQRGLVTTLEALGEQATAVKYELNTALLSGALRASCS